MLAGWILPSEQRRAGHVHGLAEHHERSARDIDPRYGPATSLLNVTCVAVPVLPSEFTLPVTGDHLADEQL